MSGQVYLAANQTEKAETILKKILLTAPNLVIAHRSLAALYLQNKQLDKAQFHLTKTIENGVQDPQFFGQLAYINLNQGHPWSAIAGYQQALLLQPNNQQWKQGLLYALQQAGNHQSALNMVDELLNKQPTDKNLWLQRAQINLSIGNKHKALSSMEMALRYGEKKSDNLLSTAQLHLSAGSMSRAAD
jgi:predicted Zn-dependent protease